MKKTLRHSIALIALSTSVTIYAAPLCSNTLEEQFAQLPSWLSLESKTSGGLDVTCIELSMNIFAGWAQTLDRGQGNEKGLFISCTEDSITRSYVPQCQTPSYMNTTVNTFNNITDCFGLDQQTLYAIIASEGGFYHNSVSSSLADFGFGQVTDPAIFDVNNNWYGFIDQMKESSKTSCQNLIQHVEANNLTPVESDDYHCSLTKAPVNPLLNALYAGMHFKTIIGYMNDYSKETHLKKRLESLLAKNFTLERYARIKEVLVTLSYNMGHNGATAVLERFLTERESGIEHMQETRREVSTKLAAINIQLLKRNTRRNRANKLEALEELRGIDQKIALERLPSIFNGDDTPNSFGVYLKDNGISHYLKILKRRVKNIAIRDKGNLCPTSKFLQVD